MAAGGRARKRTQMRRIAYAVTAVLIVLTLLFLIGGNWILAIIFGLGSAGAVWYVKQVRAVR